MGFYDNLGDFYWKIHIPALSVKTSKTQDLIISQKPHFWILLILMPRFQILQFPGAEIARLSKKLNSKLGFSKKNSNFVILSFDKFFFQGKTVLKKNLSNERMTKFEFFLENPNFEFSFLDNLAISAPGNCKIWNLGIKISKSPKNGL